MLRLVSEPVVVPVVRKASAVPGALESTPGSTAWSPKRTVAA
jgi:hypothetical protein